MEEIKQVIVIRNDLNMRKGKMVAQGAHASVLAVLRVGVKEHEVDDLDLWVSCGMTKICVRADSEQQLLELYRKAEHAGLVVAIVTDAGRTEFHGIPTVTALAIGPGKASLIDTITGDLKLL